MNDYSIYINVIPELYAQATCTYLLSCTSIKDNWINHGMAVQNAYKTSILGLGMIGTCCRNFPTSYSGYSKKHEVL